MFSIKINTTIFAVIAAIWGFSAQAEYYNLETAPCADQFAPAQSQMDSISSYADVPYLTSPRATRFVAAAENNETGIVAKQALVAISCLAAETVTAGFDSEKRLGLQLTDWRSEGATDPFWCNDDLVTMLQELAILEKAFQPEQHQWRINWADFLRAAEGEYPWCETYTYGLQSDLAQVIVNLYNEAGLAQEAAEVGRQVAKERLEYLHVNAQASWAFYNTKYVMMIVAEGNGSVICNDKRYQPSYEEMSDHRQWLTYLPRPNVQMHLNSVRLKAEANGCNDYAAEIEKFAASLQQ